MSDKPRLTPEQITEQAHKIIELMSTVRDMCKDICDEDLDLITERAKEIEPKVFDIP